MMLFRLGSDQRTTVAEKFMELGNLALIGLFFGQLISLTVDFPAAVVGFAVFLCCYVMALALLRGGGR